jgi:single-strand DNA-binding protein
MNVCTFVGRLGADIEVKATKGDKQVGKLSLATKDRKETTWVRAVYFDPPAGLVPYLVKGSLVGITARFSINEWTNKEGQKVQTPEFIVTNLTLLESKKSDEAEAPPPKAAPKGKAKHDDDDIPF